MVFILHFKPLGLCAIPKPFGLLVAFPGGFGRFGKPASILRKRKAIPKRVSNVSCKGSPKPRNGGDLSKCKLHFLDPPPPPKNLETCSLHLDRSPPRFVDNDPTLSFSNTGRILIGTLGSLRPGWLVKRKAAVPK